MGERVFFFFFMISLCCSLSHHRHTLTCNPLTLLLVSTSTLSPGRASARPAPILDTRLFAHTSVDSRGRRGKPSSTGMELSDRSIESNWFCWVWVCGGGKGRVERPAPNKKKHHHPPKIDRPPFTLVAPRFSMTLILLSEGRGKERCVRGGAGIGCRQQNPKTTRLSPSSPPPLPPSHLANRSHTTPRSSGTAAPPPRRPPSGGPPRAAAAAARAAHRRSFVGGWGGAGWERASEEACEACASAPRHAARCVLRTTVVEKKRARVLI